MTAWRRKLVFVLVFAVVPLQGVAASLSVLSCLSDTQAQATHTRGDPEHSMHHDAHPDEGGATGQSAYHYHLCCNITASAPPLMTPSAGLPDFPVHALAPPHSLRDLFIPEQPQRPPLA